MVLYSSKRFAHKGVITFLAKKGSHDMTNTFLRKNTHSQFNDGEDASVMSRRGAEHCKVMPLRSYPVPAYPTISEISQADLARVPARWQNLKSVAASLGAAAMTLRAISLEAAEAPKPPEPTPVTAVPVTDKVKDEVKETRPATVVCPLPPEKIAGEGRGAFGCVAVNPPVFLPEGEAFDIIKAEFKKHGIELVEGVELKGGKAPPQGKEAKQLMMTVAEFMKSGGKIEGLSTSLGAPFPLVKRDWKADLGTEDGKIVVEYVSGRDEKVWNQTRLTNCNYGGTVSEFDIREAAARVVEGASARRGVNR